MTEAVGSERPAFARYGAAAFARPKTEKVLIVKDEWKGRSSVFGDR